MKINKDEIAGVMKAMTVSVFTALPTIWPEDTEACGGKGILIARIDPICNHQFDDIDVVARAVVFMPTDEIAESHLCRLTIRNSDLDLAKDYVEGAVSTFRYRDYLDNDREPATSRLAGYHQCTQALLPLPVINLHDPFKSWPVVTG